MIGSNFTLFDTNVLVYAVNKASAFHRPSKNLIDKGLAGEVDLCVCPQVLKEFFSVITNPRGRIEKPIEPKEVIKEIKKLLSSRMTIIYPKEDTFIKTLSLPEKYNLKDRKAFDPNWYPPCFLMTLPVSIPTIKRISQFLKR